MVSGSNKFPVKLYNILQEAEKTPYLADIVSWQPDGKSFKVHKKDEFSKAILPSTFGTNVYKSFQRNLHFWGFHNIRKGPSKGVCSHPNFIRGQPDLLSRMRRVRAPSKNNENEHSSHEDGHVSERRPSDAVSSAESLRRSVPAHIYAAAGLDPTKRVVSPSAASSQSSAVAAGFAGNSNAATNSVDPQSAALLLLLQQQAQQNSQAASNEQQSKAFVESLLLQHLIVQQEQQQQQKRIQELLTASFAQPDANGSNTSSQDQSALVGLLASQLLNRPQQQGSVGNSSNLLASFLR